MQFTEGPIVGPLLRFALPVLAALFLQSMYGAVDLIVVGHFAENADASAVATGAQIMTTLTGLICSFAIGITVLLGQCIGRGEAEEGGRIVGSGIVLFLAVGAALTAAVPLCADLLSQVMNAPPEAFDLTSAYVRICGLGSVVIIAYNLIGSIFRGMGDSRTPLITVAIACVCNIAGDLLLVAVLGMGTVGAALATVGAQAISVAVSYLLIRKIDLPFALQRQHLRWHGPTVRGVVRLGFPIALQDLLVGISFMVILALVNNIGVVESAGVGAAERVCGFVMLIPSAFGQSMAAFVAQNIGAGKYKRARRSLFSAIGVSAFFAVGMFVLTFFFGRYLAQVFSPRPETVTAAAEYLKAYGVDCLFTCFLFCFIGYYNGLGLTRFVMVQGIVGAFCIRVPVSILMSREVPPSLFHIGLATPCSTVAQILMCFGCFIYAQRKFGRAKE